MERAGACCGFFDNGSSKTDVNLNEAKKTPTVDNRKRSANISRKESVVVKAIAQTLKVGVFTWNVGNHMPEHDLSAFLEEGAPDYDILAFGAQECDYKETVPWGARPIANKPPEYMSGEPPSSPWHHWFGVLQAWLGDDFAPVDSVNLLQMRLIVFARKHLADSVMDVRTATEATGALHIIGNKGGLIVRFAVDDTTFAFVSCHLAAHEGPKYCAQRNDNIEEVLDGGARIGDISQLDIMTQTHHTFWMGDLNYRIDPFSNKLEEPPAGKKGHDMWPKSGTPAHEAIGNKIRKMIDDDQLKDLAKHDELKAAMKASECLATFQEGDISTFRPTFKVVQDRKYDSIKEDAEKAGKSADPKVEPVWYTYQRWPAWCDRVLWHSRPHVARAVRQLEYTSCEDVMTSDHKPVKASFEVDLFPIAEAIPDVQPEKAPDLFLSNLKATNLKALDMSGRSDPYLFFWCPEIGITNETQGGWVDGTTSTKIQTLNPEWTDDEVPILKIMTTDKGLIKDSVLVISFLDHDNLDQDDDMGCCTLPLKDFMQDGGDKFEVPVYCNGVEYGKLKGSLKIAWPDPVTGKRKTRKKKSNLCSGCAVM